MATARTSPRRLPLIVAGAVFALVCGYALTSNLTDAGAARATILGKSAKTPKPNCPAPDVRIVPFEKRCEVMGRVTGFQKSIDGKKGPFKVRQTGHIVAWSVALSKPNEDEQDFFRRNLSSPDLGERPTARISILKKVEGKKYKLVRQSPIVEVNSLLGETPIFTLTEPLHVKKGMVVAITTPTWLPNFALKGVSRKNQWIASRAPKRCEKKRDLLERSKPHQKTNTTRTYGCRYSEVRLMYWAYFTPS